MIIQLPSFKTVDRNNRGLVKYIFRYTSQGIGIWGKAFLFQALDLADVHYANLLFPTSASSEN